jgi:hypothetical protein
VLALVLSDFMPASIRPAFWLFRLCSGLRYAFMQMDMVTMLAELRRNASKSGRQSRCSNGLHMDGAKVVGARPGG